MLFKSMQNNTVYLTDVNLLTVQRPKDFVVDVEQIRAWFENVRIIVTVTYLIFSAKSHMYSTKITSPSFHPAINYDW